MTRIILDPAAQAKLANVRHFAELCDQSGKVIGYFTPAIDKSLYEGVEAPHTEEELQQIEKNFQGRTLAEILADLEKRA